MPAYSRSRTTSDSFKSPFAGHTMPPSRLLPREIQRDQTSSHVHVHAMTCSSLQILNEKNQQGGRPVGFCPISVDNAPLAERRRVGEDARGGRLRHTLRRLSSHTATSGVNGTNHKTQSERGVGREALVPPRFIVSLLLSPSPKRSSRDTYGDSQD